MGNESSLAEKLFVSTAMNLKLQGMEKGVDLGIKLGIRLGIKKEKIKTAIKFIKNGYDDKVIIDITNLSVKKIKKLRKCIQLK